jgi:hypothetical protein
MDTSYPEIGRELEEKKMITPETDALMRQAIQGFNSSWAA